MIIPGGEFSPFADLKWAKKNFAHCKYFYKVRGGWMCYTTKPDFRAYYASKKRKARY